MMERCETLKLMRKWRSGMVTCGENMMELAIMEADQATKQSG
jgi:hypothetical protein